MRRPRYSTIILAILAVLLVFLSLSWTLNGNLYSVFGTPSKKAGTFLYQIPLEKIHHLQITTPDGQTCQIQRTDAGWKATTPWNDRADSRLVNHILTLTNQLLITDTLRKNQTTTENTGLSSRSFHLTLKDSLNRPLADYRLGRQTAWYHQIKQPDPKPPKNVPTTFIQTIDKKKHLYVCTTMLQPLLQKNFVRLQDHYLLPTIDPTKLSKINIRLKTQELTLTQNPSTHAWQITQPISSEIDHAALQTLFTGLSRLQATTLTPAKENTFQLHSQLPDYEIQLTPTPPAKLITIKIHPTPDSKKHLALASNRKPIFEVPTSALEKLPLTIPQLRRRTLTDFSTPQIKNITIQSLSQDNPIHLRRIEKSASGNPRLMIETQSGIKPANEHTTSRFLAALIQHQALKIVTDNPENLSPYGLQQPQKTVTITDRNSQKTELFFGISPDKKTYYAQQKNSPTIYQITAQTYTSIYPYPKDWKDPLVWDFPLFNLASILIEHRRSPPLILGYDFASEKWRASKNNHQLTADLDLDQANKLLAALESLRTLRWLGPESLPAQQALKTPNLEITAIFRPEADSLDQSLIRQTIALARVGESRKNQLFYAKVSTDPDYFLLDLKTTKILASKLIP